ncbi:MAG TPA: phosphoribosylaminoimidazolesuccinocarboxamide synthase [Thermoanaerobaculia bacterium]|nr:phosphoribosylaminoimidazolesuccinocarboxamide synthase [Thermoanaerobaculia bacterium]
MDPAASAPVVRTDLPGLPEPKRGKVRDVYDLGDRLLIVATDRLSAYDHILSPGIPDKGKLLHQMSTFWFERLGSIVPHHLLGGDLPAELAPHAELLRGRSALVRKARVVPFECVARGYLAGSGHREYVEGGTVCGLPLPPGLVRASRLPEPIFTPATKAEEGHDENVTFERMANELSNEWGIDLAARLRDLTLALYAAAAEHAAGVGLILADTKFEFGLDENGEILWIDEAATPDSSRYWDAAAWVPGTEPASFDKQFVRNWLDASGWDHQSPPPPLPEHVVAGTRERYLAAFRRVVGREPEL